MKTQVNKSEQQFSLNLIVLVSVLTFAGILFFVNGKTLFDNPVSTKNHYNGLHEYNIVTPLPEKEQPNETRVNSAEFGFLEVTEASLMVFPAQNLEESKLNVLMAENDRIINELILAGAAMNSQRNPTETESLFSAKNGNLGWKTAKGSECFFCRCNEYLARMAERKNWHVLMEIEMEWQMNNFLALEREKPLTLESWMTDEKCWCPEQEFDFNNYELLAKASEK